VTTKYNPARTWTAENSVGIGGSYLCIYGMEGPGGYQLVGRTVQIWSPYSSRPPFAADTPWLLRFFDRITWYPMAADDLLDARADMAAGRFDVKIDDGVFRLREYKQMLEDESESIARFKERQSAAFNGEREAWREAGEFEPRDAPGSVTANLTPAVNVPPGGTLIESPMTASVWKVCVHRGDEVRDGDALVVLEAMKTEVTIRADQPGIVIDVLVAPGDQVATGHPVAVLGKGA
jgi:urea carboxylase